MVDDSCWYGGGISENEKMVGVEIQTLIHGAWRAGARRSLESMDVAFRRAQKGTIEVSMLGGSRGYNLCLDGLIHLGDLLTRVLTTY